MTLLLPFIVLQGDKHTKRNEHYAKTQRCKRQKQAYQWNEAKSEKQREAMSLNLKFHFLGCNMDLSIKHSPDD